MENEKEKERTPANGENISFELVINRTLVENSGHSTNVQRLLLKIRAPRGTMRDSRRASTISRTSNAVLFDELTRPRRRRRVR